MLNLQEEKHLACYDDHNSFYSSYQFTLEKMVEPEDNGQNSNQNNDNDAIQTFFFQIKIQHQFTYEWNSTYFQCQEMVKKNLFGSCPLSLENYMEYYEDPKIHHFRMTLLPILTEEQKQQIYEQVVGKLIIKTHFRGNVFKLPINIIDVSNPRCNIECFKKTVCVITEKKQKELVICGAQAIGIQQVQEVSEQFVSITPSKSGYMVYLFNLSERVQSENVVIVKGKFKLKELSFDKSTVKIYAKENKDIFFMEGLMQHLQILKNIMGQMQPLIIFQHVQTLIEQGYRTVFYTDSASLYKKIYRSYLYDKIQDQWIIEGMVGYNRSNKHFQDVSKQLIDLLTQGEELVPLQDDVFSFDRVWKLKAIFFYHILSNLKTQRDYGSSSLANLLVEQSRKRKITSQFMFKRLKTRYGLNNFRTIYQQQVVKSTGLNRIFYEIIDLKRQNRVKIIVRQKALVNKLFRMYNYYRIKLEQEYDLMSNVTAKIIKKNNILDKSNKKKQFSGPLAVPKILKCLPYFKGTVVVETDASDMAFHMELKEQNIIEEKQSVTSKIRAPMRKIGDTDKSYEGFGWIMIDTAHTFPAFYKNQKVEEGVILEKIKKKYDSEHEEIKMLNCISGKDHAQNQKICKALIEKVKININAKENCTINVKRKILQILPVFLSKANEFSQWEDFLSFLKLYEPVCHDYSEDGYLFLLSLIDSTGQIEYKKQFGYYFQQFHKIMLKILRTNNFNHEQKELKLKKSLFNALMKWKSCYSLEILQQVAIQLKLSQVNVRASLQMLKIIFKNIFPYIKSLKLQYHPKIEEVLKYMDYILKHDNTYQLFAIKYEFELQQTSQKMQPLELLKYMFRQLDEFSQENIRKYGKALQIFKNSLNNSKKIYGMELQLKLTENQNFFIAHYLWKELTSPLSCHNHSIRLQWIKIYRIFYFYFVPIITLKKIKDNDETKWFKNLDSDGAKELLEKLRSFNPDIRWFSGYDSRSAKELKAKYQQMNDNKRKKRAEQYNFSENNVITMFIKQHPGRDSWDELAREAIRTFISIYQDKQQKCDGKQAERQKQIQEGFKKVQQKLKRGRMPESYSYQQLKEEIANLMVEFDEHQEKITDIFDMVDNALKQISDEKARREAEERDEMKIVINFDTIQEEREQEEDIRRDREQEQEDNDQINQEENQDDEEDFQEAIGGQQDQEGNNRNGNQSEKDEDLDLFE